MEYIKHEGTYNKLRENTIKNWKPQESQQVLQNLSYFLSQNMKNMYNVCQSFPRVQPLQPLKMIEKLHHIDHSNPFQHL